MRCQAGIISKKKRFDRSIAGRKFLPPWVKDERSVRNDVTKEEDEKRVKTSMTNEL